MENLFNEYVMALDTYIMVKLKEKTAQLADSLTKNDKDIYYKTNTNLHSFKIYNESKKTYVNSVKKKLEETGELEQIGGSEYFYDLVEIGSTDSNFKKYIEYIEDRPTI